MTWGTSTNPEDHAPRTRILIPLVPLCHANNFFLCQSWSFGISVPLFSFTLRIRRRLIFIHNIFLHTLIKPNSDSAEIVYGKSVQNNGIPSFWTPLCSFGFDNKIFSFPGMRKVGPWVPGNCCMFSDILAGASPLRLKLTNKIPQYSRVYPLSIC